jgi:hypothetical protein
MIFLVKNNSLHENILPVIEHSVKNKENVKFPGHCLNENILPVIEHSVKNKENVKFPGHCLKYGRTYLTLGYFFFH